VSDTVDPKLERWWGPPTYPSTFEKHDLSGGEVSYFMTDPEGDQPRGWLRVTSVAPPASLKFTDGSANEDGTPNEEMPVITVDVRLSERDGGTRMEIRSKYESREELNMLIEMGMLEACSSRSARWTPSSQPALAVHSGARPNFAQNCDARALTTTVALLPCRTPRITTSIKSGRPVKSWRVTVRGVTRETGAGNE
jgi:uncharacterized protein YndB with AHSA1/START domain